MPLGDKYLNLIQPITPNLMLHEVRLMFDDEEDVDEEDFEDTWDEEEEE